MSKNLYIDKLDDIVNKYNNKYHGTNKMKPVHLKSSTYIDFGNIVRISKYKNFFAIRYLVWRSFCD